MLASITEVVTGAETIRAYDAGPVYDGACRRRRSRSRAGAQIRAATIGAFLFPSGEVFSVLTVSRGRRRRRGASARPAG